MNATAGLEIVEEEADLRFGPDTHDADADFFAWAASLQLCQDAGEVGPFEIVERQRVDETLVRPRLDPRVQVEDQPRSVSVLDAVWAEPEQVIVLARIGGIMP